MTIAEFASRYAGVGISVLPIRADKSKAPAVPEWKRLMAIRLTDPEIAQLFSGDVGVAAIGGKISGNLEILDFDDAGYFNPWTELVEEHLGKEFYARLVIVRTPRPGFHVYARCPTVGGNQKLAMKLVFDSDAGREVQKALIETRAEGGYVLLPGCPPACHITGRTYELIQGTFRAIPEITPEEREVLLTCARSFNEIVREEHVESRQVNRGSKTPGNDFAADTEWHELLKPHGYKFAGRRGESTLWTRPGKEHGISATTNYAGSNLFYPFSTNCYPFDSERGYSKFGVFSILEHAGDFHAAAKALAARGYGEPARVRTNPVQQEPTAEAPIIVPETDIIKPESLLEEMRSLYRDGLQPGASPGWPSLKKHWTLRKQEWTLVTGIPSHGKSSLINGVMVNLARDANWKWGVFSAENLPHKIHLADLMEVYVGRPFSAGVTQRIGPDEFTLAMNFLNEHFRFIAPPDEEETVYRILACAEKVIESEGLDGLVIDPWNELSHDYKHDSETDYVSKALKKIGRFAKRHNIHVIVVVHPVKLKKEPAINEQGQRVMKYPVPTPYDASGSAHFRNKADCALCVWRDESKPGETTVLVQKIRRRFVGRIGQVELKYDVVTGRFIDPTWNLYIPRHREPGDEND